MPSKSIEAPKPITEAIRNKFQTAALEQYKAKVVAKEDSLAMRVIAMVLSAMSIASDALVGMRDPMEFLSRYATTLGMTIFLPSNIDHIAAVYVLAHECQHVVQWWAKPFTWAIIYLLADGRVAYEGEAYTTTAECFWMFTGNIPRPETIAKSIPVAYGLNSDEAIDCRKIVEQGATTCVNGGPSTEVGIWTLRWFQQHHPECLTEEARTLS